MIILGDLACPNKERAEKVITAMDGIGVFQGQAVLCNLEGVFNDNEPYQDEKLFNHTEILKAFEPKKTIFSLANNHMYDYPELIKPTMGLLDVKGYLYTGIQQDNIKPIVFVEGEDKYAIFTHCWCVYTKTNDNKINKIRIIDDRYSSFFDLVQKYIVENPDKKVICYFHWNYDMEELPFPMHRKLAKDLIDVGAYAIIGNHSHVPQGGEIYKGRAIVYGLGNFYIPSNAFFSGRLSYPDISKKMMVLQLSDDVAEIKCHWFLTDHEMTLEHIVTERFVDGEIINQYSPYREMDDKEYNKYFRSHRKKKLLVPVYTNYNGISVIMKEFFAILRIKLIKKLKE